MPQLNYERLIAQASLSIEGIRLNPDNPFRWASGYRMPIYNDNRMLLASYEHRMLTTQGFRNLIEQNEIKFDMVVGTSTAGIAPAASVALDYHVPLAIIPNRQPYVFDDVILAQIINSVSLRLDENQFDAIASTCPWAIPFGVALANREKLPFMYVREKRKGHGLEQQVEGIPIEGQNVFLLDWYNEYVNKSYGIIASNVLGLKGINVKGFLSEDIADIPKYASERSISGSKVIVIEDLISTGGSSAEEVQTARDLGAEADWCLSIFSYGLDKADEAFGGLNPLCNVRSILTYDALLEVAKDSEYLIEDQVKLLEEWREDPFRWGEKHGFPKVEKGDRK